MLSHLKVLIIEDDPLVQWSHKELLGRFLDSPEFTEFSSAGDVFQHASESVFSQLELALIDLDLESPRVGVRVLQYLKKLNPNLHCVILSGAKDSESVRKSYECGADDYLIKPLTVKKLKPLIKHIQQKRDSSYHPELCDLSEIPVLIEGETGTGKTRLAKQIHDSSERKEQAFIHLNCSEISESLIESELFGHKRGAFSGAIQDKKGKLELADRGTLFLDELGAMPKNLQVKLLKAIEEKTFYPVGGEKAIYSDFRIISATCESLSKLVEKGQFREDLFFRLYGKQVRLSPLRERKADIEKLMTTFLERSERRIFLSKEAKACLKNYIWPGNIRELERTVSQLLSLTKGRIEERDLPEHIKNNCHPLKAHQNVEPLKSKKGRESSLYFDVASQKGLRKAVEALENDLVKHFLHQNNGKVRQTLGALNISNSSFYRIFDRLSN